MQYNPPTLLVVKRGPAPAEAATPNKPSTCHRCCCGDRHTHRQYPHTHGQLDSLADVCGSCAPLPVPALLPVRDVLDLTKTLLHPPPTHVCKHTTQWPLCGHSCDLPTPVHVRQYSTVQHRTERRQPTGAVATPSRSSQSTAPAWQSTQSTHAPPTLSESERVKS